MKPGRVVKASVVPLSRVKSMRYTPAAAPRSYPGIPSAFIAKDNGTYIARDPKYSDTIKSNSVQASINREETDNFSLNFSDEKLLGTGIEVNRTTDGCIRLVFPEEEGWEDARSQASTMSTSVSGSLSSRSVSPRVDEKI